MINALLIEDDRTISGILKIASEDEEISFKTLYNCKSALTEVDALAGMKQVPPKYDIIILDLVLPDGSGFDILNEIRKKDIDIPVIILSAYSAESSKVLGFKLGADDYLCKPFSEKELFARINAILKRAGNQSKTDGNKTLFTYSGLRIDYKSMEVRVDQNVVHLTHTEFKILKTLVDNRNSVVTRETITSILWGDTDSVSCNIDPHISRIRKKIGKYGELIKTLSGIGYKFSSQE